MEDKRGRFKEEIQRRREKAEKSTSDRAAQLAYSGVVIYGVPLKENEIETLISTIQYRNSFTLGREARQITDKLLEMLKGHE